MRVVIDTNVFISSFFGGNPARVIESWKKGEIILCLSKEIIEEYIDVLLRMGCSREKEIKELLDIFKTGINSIFTAKTHPITIIKDDPDDNKFIETAVALEAEVIISGDKHLLSVGNYTGIKILNPGDFINQYG